MDRERRRGAGTPPPSPPETGSAAAGPSDPYAADPTVAMGIRFRGVFSATLRDAVRSVASPHRMAIGAALVPAGVRGDSGEAAGTFDWQASDGVEEARVVLAGGTLRLWAYGINAASDDELVAVAITTGDEPRWSQISQGLSEPLEFVWEWPEGPAPREIAVVVRPR